MHEITVSGGGAAYTNNKTSSRLALPIDLSESVEEVQVVYGDEALSGFKRKVLKLVKNEQKVLIIVPFGDYINLHYVKSKLPKKNFIVHQRYDANEEEACEWIRGSSSKKFLVADGGTVIGFEFDTVIIVANEYDKDNISSLWQRATARLIICLRYPPPSPSSPLRTPFSRRLKSCSIA